MTTTAAPPKLTPELQAVFEIIGHINTHKKAPDDALARETGRYKQHVQALIETFTLDGFDVYQMERARFFQENPTIKIQFDTYMPGAGPQEDEKRFTVTPTGNRILRLYSIGEIYNFEDPEYLISKILGVANVSVLYGRSGTGKTFTSLHLALSVAHGIEWFGRRVKQGVVWYINAEGNRNFKRRLKAWYKEHPYLEETSNFHVIPWALDLRENFQDLLNTITYTIEVTGETPILIIIDNFSTCADVDQTKQEQVTPILKQLNMLAQEYGPHVMVIHHTNKDDDFNGTMAFRNHVDTMIQLKKEDKADKNSPILFCCDKPRDDEPFKDIKTELKQIVLHTDPLTLETITSCVVVASETPITEPGLKDTAQNILDILGDRSLIYADWQKECTTTLKVSTATFDRYRKYLVDNGHIEKHKPQGQIVDHYRKKVAEADTLARESKVNNG